MRDELLMARARALPCVLVLMNEGTKASVSRCVVVTGASRGIGEAVARAFLAQGDRVAGISRSGEAPDGALALTADVTDPDALGQALDVATEAHGPVEVLVTSAGINRESLAARTSCRMWDEVISADLTGTFNAVRAVAPFMMRARKGRIVLISSAIAARGGAGLSAYGAAKGGVEGLTRSLARELAPRGISVNAVAPGFVRTTMTASMSEHTRTAYLDQIPLGRFADVEDIAGPVLFLASPAASYVTGVILGVDGGMGMGR